MIYFAMMMGTFVAYIGAMVAFSGAFEEMHYLNAKHIDWNVNN